MKKLIPIAVAAVMLAACGGSSGNAQTHRAAVDYCTFGDSSGGGNGDRPSCECAIKNAEAQGYSDQKLLAEMKDDAAIISDTKLIRISVLCAGR